MKVQVTFTVDIDPDNWADAADLFSLAAVREDVQGWARGLVMEELREAGMLVEEEPKS